MRKINLVSGKAIYKYLDRRIAGNEEYKKDLATLGYLYGRKLFKLDRGYSLKKLPRLNMFISGESGSGKTYGVQCLAEAIGLPFYRADISGVVAHGWEGTDLGTHIARFLERTPVEYPGWGILFLDEVDKLGVNLNNSGNSNVRDGNSALQANMLDILDGVFNEVTGRLHKSLYDVNNSLVILGGSFQGIRDIIKNKGGRESTSIGFGPQEKTPIYSIDNEIVDRFKSGNMFKDNWREDLIACKLMPELVNRIVTFTHTEKMSKDEIRTLLTKKRGNSINKFRRLYPLKTKYDVDNLVDKINESDSGARIADTLIYEELKNELRGKLK